MYSAICVKVAVFRTRSNGRNLTKGLAFQGVLERAKIAVHNMVQRAGFFGILLCASVSPHTVLFSQACLHEDVAITFVSLGIACS